MLRELAVEIADRARYVAFALVAAAALADVAVWLYDLGAADQLRADVAGFPDLPTLSEVQP